MCFNGHWNIKCRDAVGGESRQGIGNVTLTRTLMHVPAHVHECMRACVHAYRSFQDDAQVGRKYFQGTGQCGPNDWHVPRAGRPLRVDGEDGRAEGRTMRKGRANEVSECTNRRERTAVLQKRKTRRITCQCDGSRIKGCGDAGIRDKTLRRVVFRRGRRRERRERDGEREKSAQGRIRLRGRRSLLPTPWTIYPRPLWPPAQSDSLALTMRVRSSTVFCKETDVSIRDVFVHRYRRDDVSL